MSVPKFTMKPFLTEPRKKIIMQTCRQRKITPQMSDPHMVPDNHIVKFRITKTIMPTEHTSEIIKTEEMASTQNGGRCNAQSCIRPQAVAANLGLVHRENQKGRVGESYIAGMTAELSGLKGSPRGSAAVNMTKSGLCCCTHLRTASRSSIEP